MTSQDDMDNGEHFVGARAPTAPPVPSPLPVVKMSRVNRCIINREVASVNRAVQQYILNCRGIVRYQLPL